MYSRKIITEQLANYHELGIDLIYYPQDYIRQCVDHLEQLVKKNDKGKIIELIRPLAEDELEFIKNERLLCAIDYHHWATNYHWIRDSITQAMILFKPNTYQQVLTLAQAELEEKRLPILIQLLKARQGGGTTDTTSKIEHRMLFIPNTAGLIASSDPEKSWKLSEMISRSLARQPWWLLPDGIQEYQSGETFLNCDPRNSYISIQHGNQESGIARGDSINCGHLSELPDFKNIPLIVDDSLMNAIHPNEMTFLVLESTAKGRFDDWHKRWLTNCEEFDAGYGLERPLFLPYYLSTEIYPTEAWLRATYSAYEKWNPEDDLDNNGESFALKHAQKAEQFVRSNEFLSKILGQNWTFPKETLWWYSFNYKKAKKENGLGRFLSEFPSSANEAFQAQTGSVFNIELIQDYDYLALSRNPVGVYKLTGKEIPVRIGPDKDELLPNGKPITIEYTTGSNYDPTERWTLHPIIFSGYDATLQPLDILWVWEYPIDNSEYCAALDCSMGIGRDRSSIQILKKGTPDKPAKLVAEFTSDSLGGLEIWPIWLLLLEYYSPYCQFKRGINYCLASPEVAADGGAALMEIRKRNWPNIYIRKDPQKKELSEDKLSNLGWRTTGAPGGLGGTRPLLINWLLRIIKGRYIDICSPWVIDEMRDFVAKDNPNRTTIIEHDKSSHDDRLISLGIALVTLHELDIYQGETPLWASLIADAKELVEFIVYNQDVSYARFLPEQVEDQDSDLWKSALTQFPTSN